MRARAFLFAAGLFAVTFAPVAAQQAISAVPDAAPVAAPAEPAAPAAPLPGPRVRDDMRRVEPRLSASKEPLLRHKSSETITISTLVLVLLVVLIVILVT